MEIDIFVKEFKNMLDNAKSVKEMFIITCSYNKNCKCHKCHKNKDFLHVDIFL